MNLKSQSTQNTVFKLKPILAPSCSGARGHLCPSSHLATPLGKGRSRVGRRRARMEW